MNYYKVTYQVTSFISETAEKTFTRTLRVPARTRQGATVKAILMVNETDLDWPDIKSVEYDGLYDGSLKITLSFDGVVRSYIYHTCDQEDALNQALSAAKQQKLYTPGGSARVVSILRTPRGFIGLGDPQMWDAWVTKEEWENRHGSCTT